MMLAPRCAAGRSKKHLTELAILALQRTASSRPRSDPQALGGLVADSLNDDPEVTAAAIASSLEPASKQALLKALVPAAASAVSDLGDEYVDGIFREADFKDGNGLLDRHGALARL